MKKILLIILLASITLFSACSAEQASVDISSMPEQSITSSASLEQSKTVNNSSTDEESSNKKAVIPTSHQINDFEIIGQLPELPTGCEITALTMVLNYYKLDVDKIEMATEYLPITYQSTYYRNGKLIGPDLDNYFFGDPTSEYGYVCGTGAITTAANEFLTDINSKYIATDLSNCDVSDLYEYVSQDKPIVVWTTIEMADRYESEGWYAEAGKYVDWSYNDHCSVLIGYSEKTVTIADPLLGIVEYDKTQFEKVLSSRGSKAVALFEKDELTSSNPA